MKRCFFILLPAVLCMCSRDNQVQPVSEEDALAYRAQFVITPPSPSVEVKSLRLGDDSPAYSDALLGLGFNLLDKVYAKADKSVVLSPLSVLYALGMLSNGADDEANETLFSVLGAGDTDGLNDYCRSLIEQLPALDLSVKLKVADALFADDGIHIMDDYKSAVGNNYYASVANLPFRNQDFTKSVINEWCSETTDGMIPELIDKVGSDTKAYIINSLYFNGPWSSEKMNVLSGKQFIDSKGKKISKDYVHEVAYNQYTVAGNYRVAAKDYGDNESFRLYIVLPDDGCSVGDILASLSPSKWNSMISGMEPTRMRLEVPMFETENTVDLLEHLSDAGLNRFVNSFFPRLFTNTLTLRKFYQKAKIRVDEQGTEAAAGTVVEFSDGSPEISAEFVANRPFVYAITEKSSGTMLFAGVFDGR